MNGLQRGFDPGRTPESTSPCRTTLRTPSGQEHLLRLKFSSRSNNIHGKGSSQACSWAKRPDVSPKTLVVFAGPEPVSRCFPDAATGLGQASDGQHFVLREGAQHFVLREGAQHFVLPEGAQHFVLREGRSSLFFERVATLCSSRGCAAQNPGAPMPSRAREG